MCNRTDKTNIATPAGERQTWRNKPCLWETSPELASQLVDPQDGWRLTAKSSKKALWTCGKHQWEAVVYNRSDGRGCPYCSGSKVCADNCLATVNPELASQLVDKSLAVKLTAGSNKKALWTCGKHEWVAMVCDRSNGKGCPYCSGRRTTPETCLATVNPELASQLVDRSLAVKLTAGSGEKVLWRCDCGNEWGAIVGDRSSGSGCPECASSKMNKWSSDLCKSLGLDYQTEWRTDDCKNDRHLPFDIAILGSDEKPVALCEFQGKQHFESVTHFGGDNQLAKQQKHDQIKRDYCETQGIPLIEIHYSQRDFKNDDYALAEWFKQYLLTELHTLGIIDWDTFSSHSKPHEPAGEPSRSRFLPVPPVEAGIDRDGTGMLQTLLF